MNSRLALTLALFAPLTMHAATPNAHRSTTTSSPSDTRPRLYAFGSRSEKQLPGTPGAKLDPALADLTSHLSLAGANPTPSSLHSLSPAARFKQGAADATPLVLVDAVTRGDPQQLKSALVSLGMQQASVFSNLVSGWLPVSQVEAATSRAELHSMRASMFRTRAGAVTSQGDFAQNSAALRTTYSTLDGTGITVGALSDSYNCYPVYAQNHVPASGYAGYASNGFLATASTDVTSGDLPSGVNVLKEAPCMSYGAPTQLPFGDEGRGMLQVVHDVAPGASLAFYTAENGEADFANGIVQLASSAKANVIIDDVGYFDEPFFQDGVLAQAVNTVFSQGVAFFSAAGNDGANAYDNTAPAFTTLSTTSPTSGEYLLNFNNSGATNTTSLSISIPALDPGWLIALVLQWDQPYVTGASGSPGASSHLDLCVTGSGTDQITDLSGNTKTCTGPNTTGSDPVQILVISNPANASGPTAAETINVSIGLANGTAAPGRIKLAIEDNGIGAVAASQYAKNPTIQGHPNAAGAAAVAAAPFFSTPACGVSPAVLEDYSSLGGSPTLFDTSGTRLATPQVRQKPDFTGPDGGNNTFIGFQLAAGDDSSSVAQCANNSKYPNFFGTSAAAPHVGAIAALMLQANSSLTPTQIYTALQTTALQMGASKPDFSGGYGFIQADAALAALPPGAPKLTLGSSSVTVGTTTTLTWSSINATSCTASGGWSGTQATSGSITVTASTTAGTTDAYTLVCDNPNGTSNSATATVTAVAASSSSSSSGGGGGGGGTLDQLVLWVLGGLILARRPWESGLRSYQQFCRATPAGRHQ